MSLPVGAVIELIFCWRSEGGGDCYRGHYWKLRDV